jgi:F0F1-type ATP synthase epsilon subunit
LGKYDNWDNMFSVFGGIAEVDKDSINIQPENVKALD